MVPITGDIHAGLSGLELDEQMFELGCGILLTKTYAHLMAPFLMAFKPAPPGGHHPTPWKAASGGFSFDVTAELFIPQHIEGKFGSRMEVATTLVFLIRLGINPATTLSVVSNYAFDSLAGVKDKEARLLPFEVEPRHFHLQAIDGRVSVDSVAWVRERWQVTHKLIKESSEFALAVGAIDSGPFIKYSALTIVSLWGALEALFSPSTSELKFRVSSLIATFLEDPGTARHTLQREIAKLYDKRSAAAHGKPKHEAEDLLATFNLLRRVIMKIIDQGKVPNREELEGRLFGSQATESL